MVVARILSVLLVVTSLAACDADRQSAKVDVVAEAAAIMALETKWSEMFGAGDLNGISALLAKDSVLLPPGETPIIGAADVRAATQTMLAAENIEVSWKSSFAAVSPSGEMAYDYGTAITRLPDGSSVEGQYVVVWIREDGAWKIAVDIFN